MGFFGQFSVADTDSAAALDARAEANLACFRCEGMGEPTCAALFCSGKIQIWE